MADDTVRIRVSVGGPDMPLYVHPDEEHVTREAARMLRERFETYSRKYRGSNLKSDFYLSMAAIDVAKRYVELNENSNAEAAGSELDSIIGELDAFLH